MKKYVKVSLILGGITFVCAVLIALMNLLTAKIIDNNEKKLIQNTYTSIYDNYSYNEVREFNDSTGYIKQKVEAFDKDGNSLGFIYQVYGKNSYGTISLMVGITNLEVVDVEFLINTESFASTVNSHLKENYPSSNEKVILISPYEKESFNDIDPLTKEDISNIDTACGATYGATLVKSLVEAALNEAKGVE